MGMLKVTPLRSDWNPSLAESKTYVCFHYISLFLDIFLFATHTCGRKYTKYWLKWENSFEWLLECVVTHCSDFSCHMIKDICVFLFPFLFLAFLVYVTIWTSKHVCNTISGFSSLWIFSNMYISIMYKFCIFKNPCSMNIMKKKQLLTPL